MKRLLKILVLVYIGYVALVVMVITPIANHFLPQIYQQQTGRALHTNGIGINPFTVTFFLYHSVDKNASGSVLWSLDELAINVSLASLLGQGIVLDGLAVKSLYLHPQKNADDSWIFEDILQHRARLAANEVTSPVVAENTPSSTLPAITIHDIYFNAKHLGYSDLARPEPFEAALEDISISLKDFSTLVAEGRPYHLVARDESGGELEWMGTLSVPGQRSEGELHLRKISLVPLWRFIQSDVNFKMYSAFLDMGGHYRLSWEDPADPHFRIDNGRLALSDVDISPKTERESALMLEEFSINEISIDSEAKKMTSARVEVNAFRGTVSILEDGTTNFQSMFSSPAGNPDKTPAEAPSKPAAPWQVTIDTVRLNDAAFAFNDYSIDPDFKVRIQDFGGDIQPVSTAQNSVTRVDLKGSVDGYAPVTLAGSVKPMANPVDLDLAFNFRGIELSSFASYSGTYAGYRINSGLLTVSLQYVLQNDRIQGSNKVVINQLALGEKVNSPRLIDLPLRLALALLTDENGVIDLDVDVSGDTRNPDFSIGKIILKAFRNLIVKAVTAPFRLLADLVGGGDDFEFIPFATGQSALNEEAKASLGKLQGALAKRPQLNLGLSGLYSDEDRYALKAKSLHEQLMLAGVSQKDIDQSTSKFKRKINSLYEDTWPDADEDQESGEKYRQLVNAQVNPELALEQLRQERAMAVKLFLLQQLGLDAAKVYLDKSLHAEQRSAVKLLLEAK